ncbi:MAG TPA: sporulation protein YqfD, partial [Clostridia bacterium]
MFKKIADYISGKNKVEITGLNIDRLLNGLINSGIVLYDVTRVSHRVVIVCVTDKMLKKLFVYLKPLWYNVVVLSRWSFLHSLKTLVTQRLGLIVGFAVAIIAVITFNMFVWDIKISGNELIANDTVIQ